MAVSFMDTNGLNERSTQVSSLPCLTTRGSVEPMKTPMASSGSIYQRGLHSMIWLRALARKSQRISMIGLENAWDSKHLARYIMAYRLSHFKLETILLFCFFGSGTKQSILLETTGRNSLLHSPQGIHKRASARRLTAMSRIAEVQAQQAHPPLRSTYSMESGQPAVAT